MTEQKEGESGGNQRPHFPTTEELLEESDRMMRKNLADMLVEALKKRGVPECMIYRLASGKSSTRRDFRSIATFAANRLKRNWKKSVKGGRKCRKRKRRKKR